MTKNRTTFAFVCIDNHTFISSISFNWETRGDGGGAVSVGSPGGAVSGCTGGRGSPYTHDPGSQSWSWATTTKHRDGGRGTGVIFLVVFGLVTVTTRVSKLNPQEAHRPTAGPAPPPQQNTGTGVWVIFFGSSLASKFFAESL